jgi:hypothetical protein
MTDIDPQSEKCSIGARICNSNGPVLLGASGTWGSGCCDHPGCARVHLSAYRRSSCRIEQREPRGWGGTAAVRRVREVRRERLPVRSGLRAGGRDRGCGPGTSSRPPREVSLHDTGWRGSCWPSAKILWARYWDFQAPCLHGRVERILDGRLKVSILCGLHQSPLIRKVLWVAGHDEATAAHLTRCILASFLCFRMDRLHSSWIAADSGGELFVPGKQLLSHRRVKMQKDRPQLKDRILPGRSDDDLLRARRG